MTKKEMIEQLRNHRTLREAGITREDVLEVLVEDEARKPAPDKEQADTIAELHKTIDNLRESVKKLRAENKKLRGNQQ